MLEGQSGIPVQEKLHLFCHFGLRHRVKTTIYIGQRNYLELSVHLSCLTFGLPQHKCTKRSI